MESEKKSFYGGYIMKQTDKIGFEDIFDLTDIEKNFEQTLEFDILQLMEKWENERKEREEHKRAFSYPFQKDEQDLYIEKIVRKVLQEELQQMARGHGLFGESFCRGLESQGVERNCPTCIFNASKHYGRCD